MTEPSEFGYVEEAEAVRELELRFDTAFSWDSVKRLGRTVVPKLAKLNTHGDTEEHVTTAGSDYMYSRIDYFPIDDPSRIRASRTLARIMSGNRTELALWLAPDIDITIHQGQGMFMVGKPDTNTTKTFTVDGEVTPLVRLSQGTFYTMRAGRWSKEPLAVSALHMAGVHDEPELIVEHDPASVQDTITTPDGPVKVPVEFNLLYELRNC